MELKKLEVKMVRPSKTNPRPEKDYKTQEFRELVASVREKGVLVPILVRATVGGYEIIAGERRYRAAIETGQDEIPAQIADMNDVEAREAQIVENLQRRDIHPLEEGKAYRGLIEEAKYAVEDVAAKVGKSVTYVRDRLALTNLIKGLQVQFREGVIMPAVAALLARLDEQQQRDAAAWIDESISWKGAPDAKETRAWITDRVYADSMKNPPWKGDEQLQAALGGCEECRGQSGDLFGNTAAESCSNPACYARRMAAFIEMKAKEEPGLIPISGSYSVPEGSTILGKNAYREISSKKDRCATVERAIVVEGEGLGHVKSICRTASCDKHWATSAPGGRYKATPEEKARRKKERAAEEKRRTKDYDGTKAAAARMSWPMKEKQLDLILAMAISQASHDVLQGIAKRRELEVVKNEHYHGNDYRGMVEKAAEGAPAKQKVGLLFELLLPSYSPHYDGRKQWLAKA